MIELAVIGGGPAGLTAALYAARAGRSAAVFEGSGFGGQITLSPLVENYPGLGAVSGMELGDRMYAQAEAAGAELTFSGVPSTLGMASGMRLPSPAQYLAKVSQYATVKSAEMKIV